MRLLSLLYVVSLATAVLGSPVAYAAPSESSSSAMGGAIGLVDRIVAVVGYQPILLSELRRRSRPYLAALDEDASKDGPTREKAEKQIHRDLLERMIDELLIAGEADRRKLTITPTEIDSAMQTIAKGQGLSPKQLVQAAQASGMNEIDYRAEIRRQLLESRVLQLVIVPRITGYSMLSTAEQTKRLEQERRKWIETLRLATFIEVRL